MPKELKVVIDTNVFISALIGRSQTLSQIWKAFLEGRITPLLSIDMELEILEVIRRPEFKKYFDARDIDRFESLLKTDSIFVLVNKPVRVCRDPDDDMVLSCAISASTPPACIVSGDKDLLDLKSFHGIPILKPRDFISWLKE